MTRAPSAFAACSDATPTPDDTPVTSSHSAGFSRPCRTSMSWTTRKVSGTAAAASIDRPAGIAIASRASITAYSANAPAQRPITRCPTCNPETPAPSAAISPAPSMPAGLEAPPLIKPPGMNSPRLRPAACIFSST